MALASAAVSMGLGDSYFAQVVDDAPSRHDWRAELTYDTVNSRYVGKNRGANTYGLLTGAYPLVLKRVAADVTDREQSVAGYIPEGGQGLRFRSAETEFATVVLPFNISQTIEWVGVVHANPSSDVAIFGFAISALADYKGFGIWISSTGGILGYGKLASPVTLTGGTITLDALTHIVITRSGLSGSVTLKLYVNGVLVDTDTGFSTADLAAVIAANDESPTATLDATYCHVGVYDTELDATQIAAHYAALQWTDVTADVNKSLPLTIQRGFTSSDEMGRIAPVGVCTLSLLNSPNNSARLSGYYSPGHANVRAGFQLGAPLRVVVSGIEVFRGRVSTIAPEPGAYRAGNTTLAAVDVLGLVAKSRLLGVPLLEDVRSDQVFEAVVASLSVAMPTQIIVGTGSDTYPIALDNSQDEQVTGYDELERLATSERGYIFARRTGALEFQGRTERVLSYATSQLTISDTMVGLDADAQTDDEINQVEVTVHPRRIGAVDTTVLATLGSEISLAPGESASFVQPYTDLTISTDRVGGKDMRTPVATTDYTMFAGPGGTGADLTASLSVTANYGPNSVRWTLQNTSLSSAGIVNFLQARGRGVYDDQPAVRIANDEAAIARTGLSALSVDLPYQGDVNVGQSVAGYILARGQAMRQKASSLALTLSDQFWTLPAVLALDLSDRITVTEARTGINADSYVHGVRMTLQANVAQLTWQVIPADSGDFWELGVVGKSELDETTRLFF